MYKYWEEVTQILNEVLGNPDEIQDSSRSFYERNCLKFFREYMSLMENENRPLNAITYYDINTYLSALPFTNSHKVNLYNSLKKFFDYTYKKQITPDIMSKVIKLDVKRKKNRVIKDEDLFKIKEFVVNSENDLNDRLIMGLFLFTGLSRKYIANMKTSQIIFENGIYKLTIIKKVKKGRNVKYVIIPIKMELQLVINEYLLGLNEDKTDQKITNLDENYLSSYVSNLAYKITGSKYPPTIFSNTFIINALKDGNRVWEVSNLVLESVGNIAKLIDESGEELFRRQTMILNSI